jgi:glycosyltransferase involved in cell wall biosynthesis
MAQDPLKVAWISYFPIEWLPDLPEPLRELPRMHPAPWQRVLLDELRSLRKLKLHVIAIRKQFPRDYTFEWEGVTFHCLKVPAGMRTLSLFWWETLRIRRCLRQLRPDLVHAWGSERGAGLVASRLGYPYLLTMQGLLGWITESLDMGPFVRLEAALEHYALQRASNVTAESTFAMRWLRERYPRLELRQIEHAPAWRFHEVRRRPETKPLQLLFVGQAQPLKGTDLLVTALDKLRPEFDFRLTMIGGADPGYLAGLKSVTSPGLWDQFVFRQNLTAQEVAEALGGAAMVLYPTRVDNSPNSVKEAVAAGVPVVASAVGGIVDYILPGQNGFTFPAGDLEAFIRQIRAAVAHPLFGRGQVEPDALGRMREYLSPWVMRDKFLAAYESVSARGRRRD